MQRWHPDPTASATGTVPAITPHFQHKLAPRQHCTQGYQQLCFTRSAANHGNYWGDLVLQDKHPAAPGGAAAAQDVSCRQLVFPLTCMHCGAARLMDGTS